MLWHTYIQPYMAWCGMVCSCLGCDGFGTQLVCFVVLMLLGLQEKSPNYDSYCMLAEAYMTLQEPEKAATAYEVCGKRACLECGVLLMASHALC